MHNSLATPSLSLSLPLHERWDGNSSASHHYQEYWGGTDRMGNLCSQSANSYRTPQAYDRECGPQTWSGEVNAGKIPKDAMMVKRRAGDGVLDADGTYVGDKVDDRHDGYQSTMVKVRWISHAAFRGTTLAALWEWFFGKTLATPSASTWAKVELHFGRLIIWPRVNMSNVRRLVMWWDNDFAFSLIMIVSGSKRLGQKYRIEGHGS